MKEEFLIWGGGAIGASIGASLIRRGVTVCFVDTDRAHVGAMRAGLIVEGNGAIFHEPVNAITPGEVQGYWSGVLLCVKAQHTAAAAQALEPCLAPDGYVAALQNGLTEYVVAEHVGRERTIGGFVNFGGDIVAPGHIVFGNHGAVRVGELDGTITPRLERLAALLRLFDPKAGATDDIWSYLWGKLAYAALLYAQATGEAGIADCLDRPELLPLWQALTAEVVAVAEAEGVVPRAFNGFDPAAVGADGNDASARTSIAAMADFNRNSLKTHSGVWRDLAIHHRPTEVDAHYGPVLERGARHGIPCPTLRRLVGTIHAIERGAPQHDRNLIDLMEPVNA
jgi:2-dehydropantoate 2-reductase